MNLKSIELSGFKSFAQKIKLEFNTPISAIVGPNGSGKSNVAEAFRFVLGEQSIKSMRGKKGEDLIFNGSRTSPRSNRASVKLIFDNKDKVLNIDYDEVILERIVHRDGTNQYLINKSNVRLKDILELLSGANIGSTGHHIISQGESDKILNVNSKERKAMIEDALGLKIYYYKKKESVKKLERTEQNIKEVQGIRREIKPHLKFLEKQVNKINNTEELRGKLKILYKEYLRREKIYLNYEFLKIKEEKINPEKEIENLQENLEKAKVILSKVKKDEQENEKLKELKNSITDIRTQEDGYIREVGKIEGELIFLEKMQVNKTSHGTRMNIPISILEGLSEKVKILINEANNTVDSTILKKIILQIGNLVSMIVNENKDVENKEHDMENLKKMEELKTKKLEIEEKINITKDRGKNLNEQYTKIQEEIEGEKTEQIEAEKTVLEIKAKENEIKSVLNSIFMREQALLNDKTNFEEELSESIVLIGREMSEYLNTKIIENEKELNDEDIINEERNNQEDRRKKIERMKIRIEDSGIISSNEILSEYKETKERDEFLYKEITDLEESKKSLDQIIRELENKLNLEFKEGIGKINDQFQKFFSSMFGGGSANIKVVKIAKRNKEEDLSCEELDENGNVIKENEEGVEMDISLPHKKIRGLEMLSGGERALASIALTFAISQINPPPFIILDETDAALDESNSRKYGDIIEKLSELSQLVLITHNRETMSRAGILYGVTMGADGVSKTLSVKLDDAVKIAK